MADPPRAILVGGAGPPSFASGWELGPVALELDGRGSGKCGRAAAPPRARRGRGGANGRPPVAAIDRRTGTTGAVAADPRWRLGYKTQLPERRRCVRAVLAVVRWAPRLQNLVRVDCIACEVVVAATGVAHAASVHG